jgi:hypothetical protein
MITRPRSLRIPLCAALLVLALVPAAALAGTGKPGTRTTSSGCSISPSRVVLDQAWTVSAWGLPTGGDVNLITTYPNGTTTTGLISVASGGSFTSTQSSADALPAEQTGTYTYRFVGKVTWQEGTFMKSYATCSVQVS